MVTKSGTNQFHGSGFWFLQRKDWNAMDAIADYNPSLNANTLGGSIGGPIIKDHTFFYFDYEGVRLNQNPLIATQTIPTAWASGDLSGVPGLTLTNPLTGQVIAGNKITNINPTAAKILPLFFPTPTTSSANIDATGNNLVTTMPGKYSVNGYDGRIDHVFNANHRIFFRITQKNPTDIGTDPTAAIGALGTSGDDKLQSPHGDVHNHHGRHQPGRLLQLGHPAGPAERTAGRLDARELQLQLSAGIAGKLHHLATGHHRPARPAQERAGRRARFLRREPAGRRHEPISGTRA